MGLADAARKLLKFTGAKEIFHADDAPDNGPVVLVRDDSGGLTHYRVPEEHMYRFFVGGQMHEHVATAEDGTWIYAARSY